MISDKLYKDYNLPEGEMTKKRALIVCESSLEKCAKTIGLGMQLYLGKGEEVTGGRTRPSILADAFEALIGAIYLDGGIKAASGFILRIMADLIKDTNTRQFFTDFKTSLQEIIQSRHGADLTYGIIDETGPDHDKSYTSQVSVGGKILGTGMGRTKKEAEQNAAKEALQKEGLI